MSESKVIIQLSDLHIVADGSLHGKVNSFEVLACLIQGFGQLHEGRPVVARFIHLFDCVILVAPCQVKRLVQAVEGDKTGQQRAPD